MAGLNRVELIGNLGRDPDSRFTPNGNKVCSFTVAVNRRWKNNDGEPSEATDWFNIEAWGRTAEICQEYLKKGSFVYLEGRLQTDKYEQEGEIKFFTKVITRQLQMLDRRENGETGEQEPDKEAALA